jgi:hypothetical protein
MQKIQKLGIDMAPPIAPTDDASIADAAFHRGREIAGDERKRPPAPSDLGQSKQAGPFGSRLLPSLLVWS